MFKSGFYNNLAKLTNDFKEHQGFLMANEFTNYGALKEYWNCRQKVTLNDNSFFRKFEITGVDAAVLVNRCFTEELNRLSAQQICYTVLCNDSGNLIDEGFIYKICPNHFRWVGSSDAVGDFLQEKINQLNLSAYISDITQKLNNLAIQGPLSKDILKKIIWTAPNQPAVEDLEPLYFSFARLEIEQGISLVISRTAINGELGYEIFCSCKDAEKLWEKLMQVGNEFGITPLGLAAAEILRIERGVLAKDTDYTNENNPFELGLDFAIPLETKKIDFSGKSALQDKKKQLQKKLVAIQTEAEIQNLNQVFYDDTVIGEVSNPIFSPQLNKWLAYAMVDIQYSKVGNNLKIGENKTSAVVVK